MTVRYNIHGFNGPNGVNKWMVILVNGQQRLSLGEYSTHEEAHRVGREAVDNIKNEKLGTSHYINGGPREGYGD
jgi:hypothetical protein